MKESRTPKFDQAIKEILETLVPHTEICSDCKKEFGIEEIDINFLKIFQTPPSKLCPACRQRNRLAFANYSNIHKRKCDYPGHSEIMISPVAPIMPWITYDHEIYYSDLWNPLDYAVDFNENKTFFEQYLDILKTIPQPGVRRGANSINCDFSFYGKDMKDCYYLFGGRRSEDIMFSSSIYDSKHAVDSFFLRKVDGAYQNIITNDCYKNNYAYFSSNCIECDFIFDCRNCQNCFCCVNLRNKNYCWFNTQLTKDEYLKRRKLIDLGSTKNNKEYQEKFWNFIKDNPIRGTRVSKSYNVSGNDIRNSVNCSNVYQIDNCENVRYGAFAVMNLKDSMDVGHSGAAERIYNSQNSSTNSSNVKFCFAIKECTNCEYLMSSINCHDCFGCIAIKNASYMIFNKQYTEEEYYKTLDKIKSRMIKDGTYGEFFPMSFSPCAYNSSFAQILYPMTEKEAGDRKLFWQPENEINIKNLKLIDANELPDNIKDVNNEICSNAIIGEKSRNPFRIIEREINFYKQNNLPLPKDTPYQRMLDRFQLLNNFKIFKENCFSCNKEMESSYRKIDGFKPYCEECFQKEIL